MCLLSACPCSPPTHLASPYPTFSIAISSPINLSSPSSLPNFNSSNSLSFCAILSCNSEVLHWECSSFLVWCRCCYLIMSVSSSFQLFKYPVYFVRDKHFYDSQPYVPFSGRNRPFLHTHRAAWRTCPYFANRFPVHHYRYQSPPLIHGLVSLSHRNYRNPAIRIQKNHTRSHPIHELL